MYEVIILITSFGVFRVVILTLESMSATALTFGHFGQSKLGMSEAIRRLSPQLMETVYTFGK